MSNGTCENCKWWCEDSYRLGRGECRINAPEMDLGENGVWPSTSKDSFCGEFEPKDDRASRLLGSKYMSKDEAA